MIKVRPYERADAAALLELFRHTIRTINSADYDATQIAAWASDEINIEDWQNRFDGRHAYVAEIDELIVGFTDMSSEGYLDRLFVSADHQRCGIASALLNRIKSDASNLQIKEITANASITAKPFFEAQGFNVVQQQCVECRGARLTNYRMVIAIVDSTST